MQDAIAANEAMVSARAERAIAEKVEALAEQARQAFAEREAALVAEAQQALAEREARLTEARSQLHDREAALMAETQRRAERDATLARIESERLAAEAALEAEREALRLAEAEAERIAEALAIASARADAEAAAAQVQSAAVEIVEPAPPATASSAVVTPIARPPLKLQPPQVSAPAAAASTEASLLELLRAAAEHGASMVYAVVDTRPMMRLSGEIAVVGTQGPVAAGDVERFIFQFAPRELVADAAPEWTCSIPDVGRVRCVAFQDHSGAGLIFHLPSRDAALADDLRLDNELRSLCDQADGLIVVAGPRASGKSALLSEFVDVINSTRYDHVITIESQIRRVHEKRLSFISQREVRGDGDAIAKAARGSARRARRPRDRGLARTRGAGGCPRCGSRRAARVWVDLGPDRDRCRRAIDRRVSRRSPIAGCASLAGALRAVVAQMLVPKIDAGRIAAREVLLTVPRSARSFSTARFRSCRSPSRAAAVSACGR